MTAVRATPILLRSMTHSLWIRPSMSHLARSFAACALVTVSAASSMSAQMRHETPAAVQHYFDLTRPVFSAQRAYDQVAFMDQYFRWPGNTGFNASIHRVEDILKTAGYVEESKAKPSDVLTYRIEHRPLRQPAWEPVDASVMIAGESKPVLELATNRNMLAIGSYSTPDTGVLARLVDVGKGTPPPTTTSASVAGKVVLADGGIGRVFPEAVQKRGAIGVLAYNMPAYTQPETHRTSIQFGSVPYDSVKKSWGMPISRDAVDRLRAALAKGPVMVRVRTKSKMYPSDELTLVAEVHGAVAPSERYVLSAHVQEPGTNDNASGVGDLSEMARTMAVLVHAGSIKPKRTITMLFGLEIAQTRNFLADDSVRTRGVHWGLSLDMTGEDTKKTGGTFLIEKMPDPSAIWTRGEEHHTEWGGRAITKAELVPHYYNDYLIARCLDQAATNGWVVRANPFEGGSDHTPFLDFKKPGALFWLFTDVYYQDRRRSHRQGVEGRARERRQRGARVRSSRSRPRTAHGARTDRRSGARRDRPTRHRIEAQPAPRSRRTGNRRDRGRHPSHVDRLLRRVAPHDDRHRSRRLVARNARRDRRVGRAGETGRRPPRLATLER